MSVPARADGAAGLVNMPPVRKHLVSPPAALGLLIALSALARYLATRAIPVPWIAPDEMVYGLLGQSLYRDGELEVLDGPTPFYSALYPAVAGAPLAIDDLARGYGVLKALQALVMSLAAVPIYLWARRLMPGRWALLAAALTLAPPALAYSALIMTEVLFYPAVAVALWLLARALARPTVAAQALALTGCAACLLTRIQAVVLIPTLLTAIVLACILERSRRPLVAFGPTLFALALAALAAAAWLTVEGRPWTRLLAGYQATAETDYGVTEALDYVAYHAADVVLMVAVVPVCAVALLAAGAFHRREGSADVRAYVAVTVAYVPWLVIEVGVFASRHVERLAERDLITAAPPLFLGFAVWLARGGPRPRLATAVVALVTAALVVSLPLGRLVVEKALPDAFTLIPLWRLVVARPGTDIESVVFVGVGIAVTLFAILPRRLLPALPALALAALAAASIPVSDEVVDRGQRNQRQLVGPEPRWVDPHARRDVAYVYAGETYWNAPWQVVFWNRSVERVFSVGTRLSGPMPQTHGSPAGDGALPGGDDVRYAVASSRVSLVGEQVSESPQTDTGVRALILWRVEPPLRLATVVDGVNEIGDVGGGVARVTVYACAPGSFELTLLPKRATRITVAQNGGFDRRLEFAGEPAWTGSIPARPIAPAGQGTCTLELSANAPFGSTRLEYVRRG